VSIMPQLSESPWFDPVHLSCPVGMPWCHHDSMGFIRIISCPFSIELQGQSCNWYRLWRRSRNCNFSESIHYDVTILACRDVVMSSPKSFCYTVNLAHSILSGRFMVLTTSWNKLMASREGRQWPERHLTSHMLQYMFCIHWHDWYMQYCIFVQISVDRDFTLTCRSRLHSVQWI
jgi:hypothetical protein